MYKTLYLIHTKILNILLWGTIIVAVLLALVHMLERVTAKDDSMTKINYRIIFTKYYLNKFPAFFTTIWVYYKLVELVVQDRIIISIFIDIYALVCCILALIGIVVRYFKKFFRDLYLK